MNPVILVMGLPASGKSTITKSFADRGYIVLNRDTAGGQVKSLVHPMMEALHAGKDVVLDNTHLTVESRAPFIAAAQSAGRDIECHWMQTSLEDCQVNALHRMWDRYGQVFMTNDDIKAHDEAKRDPNMFPLGAMFAARKRLDGDKKKDIPSGKPTTAEGFSRIVKVPFVRRPYQGTRKALILDYDGTLRRDVKDLGGSTHYPTQTSMVQALPGRQAMLQRFVDQGYLLLGVSTQSGIGKGDLTAEMAEDCFAETNRQVGHDIDARYCPHHNFPVACFCRKPQPGIGIALIREFDLDPAECIMVGDLKTDQTFAERCGFKFAWADQFFGGQG